MTFEQITETTTYIQNQIGGFVPTYGIILGTGLGGLVQGIEPSAEI